MYNKSYFQASEFANNNYRYMAEMIVSTFKPNKIIEFGCGAGYLTKELLNLGIEIVSIDGFYKPEINSSKFTYFKQDFNDTLALEEIVKKFKKFDLAICMEVAEHLITAKSEDFIKVITSSADSVVFSSAVIHQSGTAHINCQNRIFWDDIFNRQGYFFRDIIRSKFRQNDEVEAWYRLNSMVYKKAELDSKEISEQLKNILESESYASSEYFKLYSKYELQEYKLNLFPLKQILIFRNFIKSLLGKPKL